MEQLEPTGWALVLGASSGFGGAVAVALAEAGFHICGVHLDRSSSLAGAEEVIARIQAAGREAAFFNVNAASADRRKEVLDAITPRLARGSEPAPTFRVLLHSLAFGTLL